MKKILFVALALLVSFASCVKDEQYQGITISEVSYLPAEVTELDTVLVKAKITSFNPFTATLYYLDANLVGSLYIPVEMIPTNEKDTYAATIPAMPNDTKINFYVIATNEKVTVQSEVKEYTVCHKEPEPPTPPTPPEEPYTKLVLNELNGDTKFIELYNMGDDDLNLEGMYLCKDGNEGLENAKWIADADVVVPAHSYLLLYSIDVQMDHPEYPTNLFFDCGLSAKKTIRMALFMPDGTERDVFERGTTGEWGLGISNVAPKSYARIPDGGDWKLADPTPNEANPNEGEDIPQE